MRWIEDDDATEVLTERAQLPVGEPGSKLSALFVGLGFLIRADDQNPPIPQACVVEHASLSFSPKVAEMTPQEISFIINVARRAPLAHMAEAEALTKALHKLAQQFTPKVGDVPSTEQTAAESTKPAT